jgi:tetratricopeptide (TPR) repeat protein
MTAAQTNWDTGNFEQAVEDGYKSLEKANSLGGSYIDLSVRDLASMLEKTGAYEKAEKLYESYKDKVTDPCHIIAATASLRDRQGHFDAELFKQAKYFEFEFNDLVDNKYVRQFIAALLHSWKLPSKFWEYQTTASMHVSSSGISASYLQKSSGRNEPDAAAIKAIEVAQLPAYPTSLPAWSQFEFTFHRMTAPRMSFNSSDENIVDLFIKSRFQEPVKKRLALLAWQETHLGKEHQEVANTLTDIGDTLLQMGAYPKAQKAYSPAVQLWDRLNIDCLDHARAFDGLAICLERDKKFAEALTLRKKSMEILERRRDICSTPMRNRMLALAKSLERQHKTAEAASYRNKVASCSAEPK